MYISYVTYTVILILILWGGKFAGFRKNYHEDFMSLEVTKSLRGFAAIGVILHHISQEESFQKVGELGAFVNIGFWFVAIFFFCSGYGLLKNFDLREDYLNGFLKKRLLPIVVPYYVSAILYALFRTALGEKMPVGKWITGLLGFSMMNEYAWFPIVIFFLYLAFYLVFKNVKNRKLCFFLIFTVIILQGVIFCVGGHFTWWAGDKNWWMQWDAADKTAWWMEQKVWWFSGEWWVNSSIAFLLGMLFADKEEAITKWFQKAYIGKLILTIILFFGATILSSFTQWKFGYWSEYSGKGPGIGDKFICYFTQLPVTIMLVILVFSILMKYHTVNPVSRFFGNVSLETYLMNLMVITALRFIEYNKSGVMIQSPNHYHLAIYAVAAFAGTVLLGVIYKWINTQILKVLNRKKVENN